MSEQIKSIIRESQEAEWEYLLNIPARIELRPATSHNLNTAVKESWDI